MAEQLLVGDQIISYQEIPGNGPTLVFLHGWRSEGAVWLNLAMALAQSRGARSFLLDLPGFGQSAVPNRPWSVGDYAVAVREFITKKKLQDVEIIGHSFGGRIGIKLAAHNYPDIKKLILIDAAGVPVPAWRKRIFKLIAGVVKPIFKIKGLRPLRAKIYDLLGAQDYVSTPQLTETLRLVTSENLSPLLKNIAIPCLIIWGSKDEETALALGQLFHEKILGSKMVVLEGAGHFSFLDEPQKTFEAVNQFI